MSAAAIRTHSLSRQLIGGVLLAELLCAALFSAVAVGHEMHGRRRAFDVMLRGRADSLMGAVQDAEDPEDNVTVDPTELVLPAQDVYEVLSPAGRVLGHSPASSSALLAALSSPHAPGYFNFRVNREHYRALRFDGVRVIDREENGGYRRTVTVLYAVTHPRPVAWGRGGGVVLRCCKRAAAGRHRHRAGLVPAPPSLAAAGACRDRRPRLHALLGVCAACIGASHLRACSHRALHGSAVEGTATVLRAPTPAHRRRRARVEDFDCGVEVQPATAVHGAANGGAVRGRSGGPAARLRAHGRTRQPHAYAGAAGRGPRWSRASRATCNR